MIGGEWGVTRCPYGSVEEDILHGCTTTPPSTTSTTSTPVASTTTAAPATTVAVQVTETTATETAVADPVTELAVTGTDPGLLAGFGLALVLLGAVIVYLIRRTSRTVVHRYEGQGPTGAVGMTGRDGWPSQEQWEALVDRVDRLEGETA